MTEGSSPLKGEMSRSDRGVPLRAAMLPTSPFWGGFAKGTCSNLSPLKREMSRSDRGVPLRAATLPTSPFRGGFARGEMSRSDRGVPLNNPPFGKESEKNRTRKTENVTADFRTVHRIPLTKCRKNDTITTIICMFRQNPDMLSVRKFLMGGSV